MKKIISALYFFLSLCILVEFTACGHGGDNTAEEAADSFSVAYFNWRFVDAQRFATESSQRWLSFAASQVTQEDVDSLRSMKNGAEVSTEDVTYTDDTTAVAVVAVHNFLALDSIGKHPRLLQKQHFSLPLVLRNDKWQVNLSSLPKEK